MALGKKYSYDIKENGEIKNMPTLSLTGLFQKKNGEQMKVHKKAITQSITYQLLKFIDSRAGLRSI